MQKKVACLHHKQPVWKAAVRASASPQPSHDPSGETVTPLIFKCGTGAAKSWCHREWLSAGLEGLAQMEPNGTEEKEGD